MNKFLEESITEHNTNKCNCDLTEEGTGLCMAGQFLDNIISEEDFLNEIGELEPKTNVEFYIATYEANELDEQPYKEVIAVFVDEIEAVVNGEKYFTSYAHLGQHSTCSQSFLAEKCRKATEEEYKDLKTELESIGYNINII